MARHQLLCHEPSSQELMVFFPGTNYTCDRSLLYFLRGIGLQQGFDALSLQYGFQAAGVPARDITWDDLKAETAPAFEQAMARNYREICFAGKSVGSYLAAHLAQSAPAVPKVSAILLTPVAEAVPAMGAVRTLAVIGTADPLYENPAIRKARDAGGGVLWQVFEGLDHSLEAQGDWDRSVAALPQVLSCCESFLRG